MILVAAVAPAIILLAGCKTPQPNYPPYYSPFREGSDALTEWAQDAVDKGIGTPIYGVGRYPMNRPYPAKIKRRDLLRMQKANSDKVANMLGGWERIAETSDQEFMSLSEFALHIQRCDNEVFFTQALEATMMLYPPLGAAYYPMTAGRRPGATDSQGKIGGGGGESAEPSGGDGGGAGTADSE